MQRANNDKTERRVLATNPIRSQDGKDANEARRDVKRDGQSPSLGPRRVQRKKEETKMARENGCRDASG